MMASPNLSFLYLLLLLIGFSLPSNSFPSSPSCFSISSSLRIEKSHERSFRNPSRESVLYSASLDSSQKDFSKIDTRKARVITPTSRSTAVFALMECKRHGQHFAVPKLENDPNYVNLEERRDRAFARLILTTSERRLGQIDKVIKKFVRKTKSSKNGPVDMLCQATLRIGAAQLLFLDDVPSYAVLKETVEVLRMHPHIQVPKSLVSFVNAVLRSIDREGIDVLKTTSVYDNINPWLVKEWISFYGEETAQTIVEASMVQSPLFLSVNHSPESTDIQRNQKIELIKGHFNTEEEEAEILPHGMVKVPRKFRGSVSSWPLYNEGEWWVQDASATLPVIALEKALAKSHIQTDDGLIHLVDLCSAPGGKTAQLCALGLGKVKVTAVEVSARRTKPLRENLERLKMTDICDVVVADGREWLPKNEEVIHGVVVDAPCTATGLGSRRPDVLRKSLNLDELVPIQRELAAHTADNLLEAGGIMVYATCSLLKQESEDQMKWLLSREEGADMETIPFLRGEIPGFDNSIDKNGWLRVLPGILGGSLSSCDGFFIARLKRL